MSKLADYYREHGESDHLKAVEAALDDTDRPATQIAELAGVSASYARKALDVLTEYGRAHQAKQGLDKSVYGQRWRWVWRRLDRQPGDGPRDVA